MSRALSLLLPLMAVTTAAVVISLPASAVADDHHQRPDQAQRPSPPVDRSQAGHERFSLERRVSSQERGDQRRWENDQTPARQSQPRVVAPVPPRAHQERPKVYLQARPPSRPQPMPSHPVAPARPVVGVPERHAMPAGSSAPGVRRTMPTGRHAYEWRDNRYRPVYPAAAPIRNLPRDHRRLDFGGKRYFETGGRYYIGGPNGFVVVAAPIGAVIASLPVGYLSIRIGGVPYFWFNGVYYRHYRSGGYVIVRAPYPSYAPLDLQVVVQVQALNMRSGPGLDYPVLSVLYQGEVLSVIGRSDGWYQVALGNGETGWVMSVYTASTYIAPSG